MSKVDSNLDVLFDVRNTFYLGNYQQCVNAAQNLRVVGDADKTTKDVFLYRAYIAQNNFGIPLDEISSSTTNLPLLAIRLFATYLAKNGTDRSVVLEEVEKKLASGTIVDDYFHVIVAQIYMREQNYESALRVLHQTETLESKALTIQCLLNINRVDLALKDMKKMQDTDEDATITQLTLALVNTAIGKEKLQDAFYIYQEMMDKYGETPLLLVSQASCLIMQQKYSDAEKLLLEALQRDANNAEALINMIVCGQFLGKAPEVSNRYVNQLKQFHPNHAWVRDCESKERLFDRIVQQSTSVSA